MRENKLADLSMLFSVNALELTNLIEGHYSLKNQFERSATRYRFFTFSHCYFLEATKVSF